MPGVFRSNIVRFVPDDASDEDTPLYLTLESPWKFSAGLKPDVNEATVSYKEFDKLNGAIDRTGRVEFFYNNSPDNAEAEPDVLLENWRIVDVVADKMGEVKDPTSPVGVPTDSTGSMFFRIVTYKLYFADFREQFVFPRGGRVALGLLNAGPAPDPDSGPPPAPPVGAGGSGGVPELDLSQLIQECLDAMGVDAEPPAGTEAIDAPRDLKWFGNHAPTELAKLLEVAGLMFCPDTDGGVRLEFVQTTGGPVVGSKVKGADALLDCLIPAIDRRGKAVIFSSYPTQTVETLTMAGPRPDQWYFVVQDSKDDWVREANCDLLTGVGYGTLLAAWNDSFSKIDPAYRDRMRGQAFACIQLDDGTTPPPAGTPPDQVLHLPPRDLIPILTRRVQQDGTLGDITVAAIVAVLDQSAGTWSDSETPVFINAAYKSEDNVVLLSRALFRVNGPTAKYYGDAVAMSAGNFAVTFSVPKYYSNNEPPPAVQWLPDFFHVGFKRDPADKTGNTIKQLSDADVQNALTAGNSVQDLIFVTRPDFRLKIVDENYINLVSLTAKARGLANKYLANSADPTRLTGWRGFADVTIDGLVSEVEWDQKRCMTTAILNNWYRPGGALDLATLLKHERGDDEGAGGSGGAGGAYPNQGAMQESRVSMTEPGANRPMVPLQPIPSAQSPCRGAGTSMSIKVLQSVDWDSTAGVLSYTYLPANLDMCNNVMVQTGNLMKVTIDTAEDCG